MMMSLIPSLKLPPPTFEFLLLFLLSILFFFAVGSSQSLLNLKENCANNLCADVSTFIICMCDYLYYVCVFRGYVVIFVQVCVFVSFCITAGIVCCGRCTVVCEQNCRYSYLLKNLKTKIHSVVSI